VAPLVGGPLAPSSASSVVTVTPSDVMVALVDSHGEIVAVIAKPADKLAGLAEALGIDIPALPEGVSTISVLVSDGDLAALADGDFVAPGSSSASAAADRPALAAAIRRGAWKAASAVESPAPGGPISLTEHDLTPLPLNAPAPSSVPTASSGSAGSFSPPGGSAGGFAALSALLGIAAAIIVSRRIRLSPAVWRPVAFHSPLERPG
jgi:hypothetical protein